MSRPVVDAVVVGAGPNGLAAAITLARAGLEVEVLERDTLIGGGSRTEELTLPGFRHDVCSAIHPLGLASPFFKTLPLEDHGLEWIEPDVFLAHPVDGGEAALLQRSIEDTAASLGRDGRAYARLMRSLTGITDDLVETFLGRLVPPAHPLSAIRFGPRAIRSAAGFGDRFKTDQARALLPGISGHALVPLEQPATASFGLLFAAIGHVAGWPLARGGSQAIVDAMASYLESLGGKIVLGHEVRSMSDLPGAKVTMFDLTPRQILPICGDELPSGYRRKLERFRYGAACFKIDWALSEPVPWINQGARRAGTVHLGGTLEEIVRSEDTIARGQAPESPYMVVAQQSLFDDTRAPQGKHTLWGYCHVPNGCDVDMVEPMERQIERFAPGFKDLVIERAVMDPAALEKHNPNYVGGDINGGAADLRQLFTRPVVSIDPWSTPADGIYICSSSTPPGGGVHGMCGNNAARSALKKLKLPPRR